MNRHYRLWPLTGLACALLVAAPSFAQDDDNPYGDEPAATAPAKPAARRPKAAPHRPASVTEPATDVTKPAKAADEAKPAAEKAEHGALQAAENAETKPAQEKPTYAPAAATEPHRPAEQHAHGDAHGAADTHAHVAEHGGEHAQHGEHGEHGAHAGHDHNAPPEPINWYYGMLGVKDDLEEPNLLWRTKDMPPPYSVSLLNFLAFAFIIYKFGKKPLGDSLKDRKKVIQKEMDAAQAMKKEAEARLAEYQRKLDHLDEEVERIRREFREQGERDKKRIIAEAEARRERMIEDAKFMIEQESKRLQVMLKKQSVEAAVTAAEKLLVASVNASDEKLAQQKFLEQLDSEHALRVTKGGAV